MIATQSAADDDDNNNEEEMTAPIVNSTLKRERDTTAEQDVNIHSVTTKIRKRQDALVWDDYFMAVSFLSSLRSKDPSTQVGACIVNEEKRIVGIGYNGFPRGCDDNELPWDREACSKFDTKYMYVVHAEVNAILNKNSVDLKKCTMYVALFPCNECAKVIIQSGIEHVIYMSDKYKDTEETRASKRMFAMSKVSYTQFLPQQKSITIDFSEFCQDCV